MEINKDLIAASSTPIVLERVREPSDGRMEWTDGMLYPVLHRLEKPRDGNVTSRPNAAALPLKALSSDRRSR
jgi:hypothetical protein